MPSYLEDVGTYSSNTETFVAIKTYINNWRWNGVPFTLEQEKE